MYEYESDEALYALKNNRPACVPLFQLPPTNNTRHLGTVHPRHQGKDRRARTKLKGMITYNEDIV